MSNLRSGPPQWPLSVPTQEQVGRTHRPGPRHATGEWRTVPGARPAPPPAPPEHGLRRSRKREDASRWHWLLWIPIVLPLVPALYNRIEPTFIGIPFFYWAQLGFAFLASVIMTFVHRRVK
ncbi:DUF3311 domain-containing protein [Paractinoplanes rishiriensis]|uniref:DUF3311 domain-containing protein n=1 Tax=Paractinoplanes rishiriensis TaxID=1050105 RepID=A0A919MVL8_9ACTN|nr:DUF3311 domain-containing protein [Actinoplanes rishiriensis]GIE96549.1 hypothetical protein Ari01nite_40140 [Actinoplanes rishiriensis]